MRLLWRNTSGPNKGGLSRVIDLETGAEETLKHSIECLLPSKHEDITAVAKKEIEWLSKDLTKRPSLRVSIGWTRTSAALSKNNQRILCVPNGCLMMLKDDTDERIVAHDHKNMQHGHKRRTAKEHVVTVNTDNWTDNYDMRRGCKQCLELVIQTRMRRSLRPSLKLLSSSRCYTEKDDHF